MDKELLKVNLSPYGEDEIGGETRLEANVSHLEGVMRWNARLQINYAPRETVIDAISLGEFLDSVTMDDLGPEQATHDICEAIRAACEPMALTISAQYANRNGVSLTAQARYVHPDMQRQQQGPRILAPGHG